MTSFVPSDTAPAEEPPAGGAKYVQSSSERNIWSMHNLVWRRSAVAKARQPSIKDSELSWSKLAQPHQLSAYSGMKLSDNAATLACLQEAVRNKVLVEHVLFTGAASSGKTALCSVFVRELMGTFAKHSDELQRLLDTRVLHLTAEEASDSDALQQRLKKFLKAKDKIADVTLPLLLTADIAAVKQQGQIALCLAADSSNGRLKLLLTCRDDKDSPMQVAACVRERCHRLRLQPVCQEDAVSTPLYMNAVYATAMH
jgi:hypothetical protein